VERSPGTDHHLDRAIGFAARHHGDQRRPAGQPYVEHSLETLEALADGAGVTDPGCTRGRGCCTAAQRAAYYAETVTCLLPLAAWHPWVRAVVCALA